jgi:hypothetical protein
MYRLALKPIQTPLQWLTDALSRGKARPGREADNSPNLVLRSIMSRSYTSSLPWRVLGGRGTALLFTLGLFIVYLNTLSQQLKLYSVE